MNIIVCIKQVMDPETPLSAFKIDPTSNAVIPAPGIPPVVNGFDEQAVEAALRIKDKTPGTKVTVITLNRSPIMDVVKKPLSMGADELILIQDPAFEGGDSFTTAHVLAAAVKKTGAYDLILCGRQASDWDNAQVGSGIAEILGLPCVTLAKRIEVHNKALTVERALPDATETQETTLPAVVTVTNELGQPRYPTLRGIMAAGRKQPIIWKSPDLALDGAKVGALGARLKLLQLSMPTRKTACEIVTGQDAAEAGRNLALKLRQDKII